MGIGYALASGLVQGFTQNIGREMEKRASEKERVNKLRDAILVSSVGDNFNNANVEAIQKMISSSEQQMQERGGIDLFGTRSDDILSDDEMTGLLGSLKSTMDDDEDEKFYLGGFELDSEIKFDKEGSYQLLNNWTRLMSDQANVDLLLTKTPADIMAINSAITTARRVISTEEIDTKTPGAVKAPNLTGVGEGAMFPGIENWDNFASGAIKRSSDNKGVAGWKVPDVATIIPKLNDQGTNVSSIGTGKIGADGKVSYQYLDYTNMPIMQEAHDELATALGLQGEEQKALLHYWQQSFMKIPGDPATIGTYTANALEGAIQFGLSIANPSEIKMSTIRQSIAGDGAFANMMYTALNSSTLSNESDTQSKVYALAAHLPAPVQVKPATIIGDRVSVDKKTVQMYILQKVFGPDKDKIKFEEFMNNQNELGGAVKDLNALKTEFLKMVKDIDDAGGELTVETANMAYEQFKKQVKFVFDTDQGILGGVMSDVKSVFESDGVTDARMFENDTALTSEYRNHLESLVKKAKSGPMAKLEAMRISLAFRMARAADPSGRLSNQDIEIQLRKLGSNFTSISDAVSAIDVSIDEFTRKQEQYAIFAQYAADDYIATPEDLKVIDAAIMVDELERGVVALNKAGSTITTQPEAPTIDPGDYTILNDGTVVDGNFNTITDPDIIAAVKGAST